MMDRELVGQKVREFCDGLWQRGDFWDFENSRYEKARCARLIAMLEDRRYQRVLEIGCGAGHFTRLLSPLAGRIVALDVSPTAVERARAVSGDLKGVDFRVANAMDYTWQSEGPWDLIVFNDTICYLGWLYSFFDVAWLASQLFETTASGGRLLMANSMDEVVDKLLLPYITRTYRDLFLNVGFGLDTEEIFSGTKNGVDYKILVSLFGKAREP